MPCMKCLHRWTDPLRGRTETQIGPYSCGRPAGHKGVHAHTGAGAAALWKTDGELLLSIQRTGLVHGDPSLLAVTEYPEMEELEPEVAT